MKKLFLSGLAAIFAAGAAMAGDALADVSAGGAYPFGHVAIDAELSQAQAMAVAPAFKIAETRAQAFPAPALAYAPRETATAPQSPHIAAMAHTVGDGRPIDYG